MSNPFVRLKRLLPDPPLLVGTVLSVDNGMAAITQPGGGVSTARGDVSPGDYVFFRNGVIEGDAPPLTLEVIVL